VKYKEKEPGEQEKKISDQVGDNLLNEEIYQNKLK